MKRPALAIPTLGFALASIACPQGPRDVVPETRDVRGGASAGTSTDAATATPPGAEDYVYVVQRPHGAVGLVGSHFMSAPAAKAIVDRVADELEACACRVEQRGELASGAIQLVVITGSRGTAEVTDMKLAPGGPVAANALECIVAPLRATALPTATDAGVPALAIEATWGRARPGARDAAAEDGSR